ncbi:glucosamine inositolphosphorylceramide transferase family protein [Roseovarius salis]|uniref:glucosamine inositolphosphorylceramide transferase family protein n=1 Tax=Roseovarius salis TaxID=3376063 RepID=UPI0037CC2324
MTRQAAAGQQGESPVAVSIVVGQDHLRWRSLEHLLDGLTGPLTLSELLVSRSRPDRGAMSGLLAAERAMFAPARAGKVPNGLRKMPKSADGIAACDVIIDFRPGPVPGDLAARARHGVWQFSCHDTGTVAAAVMRGDSALGCRILCRTARSPVPGILSRCVVGTKLAVVPTQAFASEKSAQLMLRELRRLALCGALPEQEPACNAATGDRDVAGRAILAGYLRRVAGRVAAKAVSRVHPTRVPDHPFELRIGRGDYLDVDPGRATPVPQSPDMFCADPFLIEHREQVYCFYEEYPFGTGRGHIAVGRIAAGGLERIGPALVAGHHLSFPYVFEDGGEVFMVPETLQAGRIEVWRSVGFPTKWDLHATALAGVPLADPVLVRHGGKWWLFANSSHDGFGDFSSELCLFRTDGPGLGRIEAHPLNPVAIGSDVARGGGRVFERGGRLYRYSQDNSGGIYGYGLNLMEITELSDTGYAERRVAHFTPGGIAGAIGCHHADAAAGCFVVDVRRQ